MYRIRANNEPTYATLMYEPLRYRLGSQRGNGTILSTYFTSDFNLQQTSKNSIAESSYDDYDDGVVISVPPKGFILD